MKILVVEDEHQIANSIKKGFEQEHFIVDTAFSGTGGLDLASEDCYDAIILDLMLPGISGLEIIEKLRKEKNHTPILVLTAKGRSEDKVEGLRIGADDYLTKPFSFEELVARVRALTRRSYISTSNTLRVGDLILNLDSREIKRGQGQQFMQSPQEQNRGSGLSGRPISGEITAVDDVSVTVKSPDGSSKIVILSETTKYSKSVDGAKTDLKAGDKVMVIGQSNSDGSVTAQTVQLNPNFAIR